MLWMVTVVAGVVLVAHGAQAHRAFRGHQIEDRFKKGR